MNKLDNLYDRFKVNLPLALQSKSGTIAFECELKQLFMEISEFIRERDTSILTRAEEKSWAKPDVLISSQDGTVTSIARAKYIYLDVLKEIMQNE